MGANESKEILENEELKKLRQVAEEIGPCAAMTYITENIARWKNGKVKLAITGRTATGKSTFINAIRNVGPGDPMFAKPGSGNTTKKPTMYEDPNNRKVVYYDLPGFATLQFRKTNYIKEMKIYDYDYFLIFFDKVIGEDDYWMIQTLKELRKPFSLVRSKIDSDVINAKYDGRNDIDIIPEIRGNIIWDCIMHEICLPGNTFDLDNIFLVSCRDKELGDMNRLIKFIKVSIPFIKFETMMLSISFMLKEVFFKKYKC